MSREAEALNAEFVGRDHSRAMLETPALLLDADAFERNIATLAGLARDAGIGLRPHAKTHKCANIAKAQLAAGALGICCAKSGELLALFEAGVTPLMLTAPVASRSKIDRLARAAASGCDLTVVVDRPGLVADYGQAARSAATSISVLIDCDTGLGRTGLAKADDIVELARAVDSEPGLRYAGVQAYAGHVQHIHSPVERRDANRAATARVKTIVAALEEAGLAPLIVTGGGTGSHALDFEERVLTEVQAGSYIFMDEGYRPVEPYGRNGPQFDFSMFVSVTVIAHNARGDAITDGGSKSFAIDGPAPRAHVDGREIGTVLWVGDEFGKLHLHEGISVPPIGTRIECTVPHCDPTANLHDVIHVVRGERLEAIWSIEGRGRSD
jgi:D-serine deaminase-like pyridoxal phosphate-dependent protein